MATRVIRVSELVYQRLKTRAAAEHRTMVAVLERWLTEPTPEELRQVIERAPQILRDLHGTTTPVAQLNRPFSAEMQRDSAGYPAKDLTYEDEK